MSHVFPSALPPPALAGEALLPAWPPPPHDPRERDLTMLLDGWEVRLFGGRKFEYFVARDFWHLQLWHPEARVSLLTPSRLTCGFYEAFPIAGWKAQAPDYGQIARMARREHGVALPEAARVEWIEHAFVHAVVRQARPATARDFDA
jgi:hypothetical protein